MSQFFMDSYVNMVGSNALNYYNVEQVDNLLSENNDDAI